MDFFIKKYFSKEAIQKNKELHIRFRNDYTERQLKIAMIIALCLITYGIIALTQLGSYLFVNRRNANVTYQLLILISLIVFSISWLGKYTGFFGKGAKKAAFFQIFVLISATTYIAWGFVPLIYSILEGRETNYLPIIMVYATCCIFLFFSVQHYIAYYCFCLIGCYVVLYSLKEGVFDNATVINIVIFGFILTVGGISKYLTALREFVAKEEASRLREDIEANNEELLAINRDLQETTEELERRNESQRLFTASMSHEIRSPLNGVIGLLQVLLDDKNIKGEERESLDKAFSSSANLIQIVNDLLDYSKLEAGEFNIINGTFDLREVVANIKNASEEAAKSKGLEFTFEIDDKMPCLFEADGVRVQQVIQNIVSNGIKYTDSGFVRTVITYDNDILTIVVKDSGQGISEQAIETLFEPFKRFNEKKNKFIQGTGLGLSIVKKLVDQMKGDIYLTSTVGKGSNFTIRIPMLVKDQSVRYGDKLEKVYEEVKTLDLTGRKILCIDDNKVNLAVVKGLLKGTGVDLKLLASGKECLEEVTKEKYDLIFLDHMMPEMNGLEVYEKMGDMEHLNKETPIVMLTANAGKEAEALYLNKGFNGYLSKPLLKQALNKKIQEIFGEE